jgi:putative endonuclease
VVTKAAGRGAGAASQHTAAGRAGSPGTAAGTSTTARGEAAELRALAWLQAQGLVLEQRNYRVARGPSARGGEIDLVMRDRDGTLVFVEVRQRRSGAHGGAAASVTHAKQRRLVLAAQHYLLRFASLPPCRFDVLALDGEQVEWLQAAFEA